MISQTKDNKNFKNWFKTQQECEAILEEYGIIQWYYRGRVLNESEESKEADEMLKDPKVGELMGELGRVTALLIKTLTKKGLKLAVKTCVKAARTLYKNRHDIAYSAKYLFYALLFFAVGYIGNTMKDRYNENPIIKGTQIEFVDSCNAMVVTNDNGGQFTVQQKTEERNEEVAPVITQGVPEHIAETQQTATRAASSRAEVIHVLGNGEKKSAFYHASPEIIKALAEVEHFVPYIYDAKKGVNARVKRNQMTDMSKDLTIGYGHKLTPEERRTMAYDTQVTKQWALDMYKKDLAETERILNIKLKTLPYDSKVEYSQGFIDGTISLLFNMGAGNMFGNQRKSECEFWRRLKACRLDEHSKKMNPSDIAYTMSAVKNQNITQRGHVYRRAQEYKIMTQDAARDVANYHLIAPEYRQDQV